MEKLLLILEEEDREKFNTLERLVSKYANDVNTGALLQSIESLRKAIQSGAVSVSNILDQYPIVCLNDHGINHIKHVLLRAEDILTKSSFLEELNSYEVFILLCSILVHDIGNLQGRDNHEMQINGFINSKCKDILPDSVERRQIARIATVHGGQLDGNKDTISKLEKETVLNNYQIRSQFLAALLRFADEVADDKTRASTVLIEENLLPPESKIYHQYSKSLHSVEVIGEKSCIYIKLTFALSVDEAQTKFTTFSGDKYLLDEIYDRTIKMEKERIYCNQFLRPNIYIDRIEVEINIFDESDIWIDTLPIKYVLQEKGYPSSVNDSFRNECISGEQLAKRLNDVKEKQS